MEWRGVAAVWTQVVTVLCGILHFLHEAEGIRTDNLPLQELLGNMLFLLGSVILRISQALTNPSSMGPLWIKKKSHNKKRSLRVSVRERVVEGWLSEEKLTDGRVHRDSEREPGKLNLRLRKNNYWKVFYRKSPCKLHTFILPYGSSCSNREGKKRNNPWNILGTFYFFS